MAWFKKLFPQQLRGYITDNKTGVRTEITDDVINWREIDVKQVRTDFSCVYAELQNALQVCRAAKTLIQNAFHTHMLGLDMTFEIERRKRIVGADGVIRFGYDLMKSFGVKYAPVSAVTVNGATFATDTDAVKAINALDTTNNVSAADPRVDGIVEVIPPTATPENQLVDTDKLNSSIQAMAAHKVSYDAAGGQFPTKAALLAATTYYRGGVPYVPTEHDYLNITADESAPAPFTNGQTRYVFDGAVWAYDMGINEQPFTASESAVLASGITLAKVQKYDGYANQLPQFTNGTIYAGLYTMGFDILGNFFVNNNSENVITVSPNYSSAVNVEPGAGSTTITISSQDTLVYMYGVDSNNQYFKDVYAVMQKVRAILRLYHGAGAVGP